MLQFGRDARYPEYDTAPLIHIQPSLTSDSESKLLAEMAISIFVKKIF